MSELSRSKRIAALNLPDWVWEVAENESNALGGGINKYISDVVETLFKVQRERHDRRRKLLTEVK